MSYAAHASVSAAQTWAIVVKQPRSPELVSTSRSASLSASTGARALGDGLTRVFSKSGRDEQTFIGFDRAPAVPERAVLGARGVVLLVHLKSTFGHPIVDPSGTRRKGVRRNDYQDEAMASKVGPRFHNTGDRRLRMLCDGTVQRRIE
jgi:hypothetical protein